MLLSTKMCLVNVAATLIPPKYDLDAICRDLKEQEKKIGRKVVSLRPRKPAKWAKTA